MHFERASGVGLSTLMLLFLVAGKKAMTIVSPNLLWLINQMTHNAIRSRNVV